MQSLPNNFPSFFYRSQHKWYFNSQSLLALSETLGANVEKLVFKHRYGFTNFHNWLNIKKPTGHVSDSRYLSIYPAVFLLESTGKWTTFF